MTPMTYLEAKDFLKKSKAAIDQAVAAKTLDKYPMAGQVQHVIKEQVELFQGKRLSKKSLSEEETAKWERYHYLATNQKVGADIYQKQIQPEWHEKESPSYALPPITRDTAEFMHEKDLVMKVQTSPGSASFHSAQSDEADSKNADITFKDAVTILIGLIALFFAIHLLHRKQELEQARAKAEQELLETGLQKEDLEYDRRKSLKALLKHPKQALRIQQIIEDATMRDLVEV